MSFKQYRGWEEWTLLWQKTFHEPTHVSASWDHIVAVAATDAGPGMLFHGCALEP